MEPEALESKPHWSKESGAMEPSKKHPKQTVAMEPEAVESTPLWSKDSGAMEPESVEPKPLWNKESGPRSQGDGSKELRKQKAMKLLLKL